MTTMSTWTFDKETLEETLDVAKSVTLADLVNEGLLSKDVAEHYCASHVLIIKKKSIFRTISDRWFKEKERKGLYLDMASIKVSKEENK